MIEGGEIEVMMLWIECEVVWLDGECVVVLVLFVYWFVGNEVVVVMYWGMLWCGVVDWLWCGWVDCWVYVVV